MKFTLSKSVKDAINNNKPVLALESTIIASGMPYPQNIEFQNKAERICANLGVTPATIAIIKGVVHIGLAPKELNFIATNPSVKKISKREIGICLEKNISGATTVATLRGSKPAPFTRSSAADKITAPKSDSQAWDVF